MLPPLLIQKPLALSPGTCHAWDAPIQEPRCKPLERSSSFLVRSPMANKTSEQGLYYFQDEMEQAKALYESAKEEFDRAEERMRTLGMAHPDGSVRYATKVFDFMLRSYRLALIDYNRFVLDGKLPESAAPATPEDQKS